MPCSSWQVCTRHPESWGPQTQMELGTDQPQPLWPFNDSNFPVPFWAPKSFP